MKLKSVILSLSLIIYFLFSAYPKTDSPLSVNERKVTFAKQLLASLVAGKKNGGGLMFIKLYPNPTKLKSTGLDKLLFLNERKAFYNAKTPKEEENVYLRQVIGYYLFCFAKKGSEVSWKSVQYKNCVFIPERSLNKNKMYTAYIFFGDNKMKSKIYAIKMEHLLETPEKYYGGIPDYVQEAVSVDGYEKKSLQI